jgi:hypothetical protein
VIGHDSHATRGPMTIMDSEAPVEALPVAGAPFRNKVWAWAILAAAVLVATVSSLIGMAPYYVEDGQTNVIDCGPSLFHSSPRPSPLCDALPDFWQPIAEVGLVIAACMVVAAAVFGIRSFLVRRAGSDLT